jgi:N6-L-threonylcarbamoyladenine synthase
MLGVHHMQAHALTPRLVHALESASTDIEHQPAFPFLTLLVSGGHTMLLHSKSLNSHTIIANTRDIAIGDCLDKCGRDILPESVKISTTDTAYGKYLSNFAFRDPSSFSSYPIPHSRADEIDKPPNKHGWTIKTPLSNTRNLSFSFSGIATTANRLSQSPTLTSSPEERLLLARTVLGTAFEHLASRIIIALESLRHPSQTTKISTLVVSGGVAANSFLRYFLRAVLDARGFSDIKLIFPSVELCTDNAAMIAWAGMEMYEAGYRTSLACEPRRKWSMDDSEVNGEEGEARGEVLGRGILGVGGWEKV